MYISSASGPPIRVTKRSPEERVAADKAKHRRYRERRKLRQQDLAAGITIAFRHEDPAAKEKPARHKKLEVLGDPVKVPAMTRHCKEADERFRKEVLSDLHRVVEEKTFRHGDWGYINVAAMCKILRRTVPPRTNQCPVTLSETPKSSIEALFLSTEGALEMFESREAIDVPLFTKEGDLQN